MLDATSGGGRGVLTWDDADRAPFWTLASGAVIVLAPILARTGLPPSPLMWPLYRLGVVLPGCGLTRGVIAIARGDLVRAWEFNPASYIVLVLAAGMLVRLAIAFGTSRWLAVRLPRNRALIALGTISVLALWVNQQAHAEVLIHHTR